MISKNIFQEVMKLKLKDGWDDITIKDNKVNYWLPDGEYFIPEDINIYELSHKCKVWAFSKGYPFNVYYKNDYFERCEPKYDIDLYNHRKSFCNDTEPEAIFKACEWILKEIEK